MPLSAVINHVQSHPRITALVGVVSGWASVDWLRTSQIVAAVLASMVTLCSLILILPKVVQELCSWYEKIRSWFSNSK